MLVEAKGLSFAYSKKLPLVLNKVDFHLEKGRIAVLLGPNGVGKSTLIKLLLGILKPKEGELLLEGQSYQRINRNQMARSLAYVPQSQPISDMSVFDSVLLGRIMYMGAFYNKEDLDKTEAALKDLGLSDLSYKRCSELSGGERQKVAIARALASDAKGILFDEPTSNLDVVSSKKTALLIQKLAHEMGKAVLLCMHDISLAHFLGQDFYLLSHEGLVGQGGKEILNEENLSKTYGSKVSLIRNGSELFVSMN